MFAVHHGAATSQPSRRRRFNCAPIAPVDDVRLRFTNRANKRPQMKGRLGDLSFQANHADAFAWKPARIGPQLTNRAYHVLEALGIESLDQVDHPVFEAALTQAVNEMHDA